VSWDEAIAAVELFRAEAELEIQEIEDEQRREWRAMSNDDDRTEKIKKRWPWHSDPKQPPGTPPREQIPKMAVYERKELINLLQVAPSEALHELYEQINGGPQAKGWKHGVAELSMLLRGLLRP
jgi:hypothetical protein